MTMRAIALIASPYSLAWLGRKSLQRAGSFSFMSWCSIAPACKRRDTHFAFFPLHIFIWLLSSWHNSTWLRLLASVVGFGCWLRASGCVLQDAYILHHRNNRHYDYCNITHGRPTTDGRLLSGPWLGLVSLARRYRMIRSITAQSTTKVRLIKFLEYKISPHPLLFLLDFCYWIFWLGIRLK